MPPETTTQEFLATVAGSWGDDVADDIPAEADLAPDCPREPL